MPFSTDSKTLVSHEKKSAPWDWTEAIDQTFVAVKWAIQEAQDVQVVDPGRPFELDVHVTQEGYGWGPWQ